MPQYMLLVYEEEVDEAEQAEREATTPMALPITPPRPGGAAGSWNAQICSIRASRSVRTAMLCGTKVRSAGSQRDALKASCALAWVAVIRQRSFPSSGPARSAAATPSCPRYHVGIGGIASTASSVSISMIASMSLGSHAST